LRSFGTSQGDGARRATDQGLARWPLHQGVEVKGTIDGGSHLERARLGRGRRNLDVAFDGITLEPFADSATAADCTSE
jgi:hypothetical protein